MAVIAAQQIERGTGWCDSCRIDGLYPTHDCERVQFDLASIRLLRAGDFA